MLESSLGRPLEEWEKKLIDSSVSTGKKVIFKNGKIKVSKNGFSITGEPFDSDDCELIEMSHMVGENSKELQMNGIFCGDSKKKVTLDSDNSIEQHKKINDDICIYDSDGPFIKVRRVKISQSCKNSRIKNFLKGVANLVSGNTEFVSSNKRK